MWDDVRLVSGKAGLRHWRGGLHREAAAPINLGAGREAITRDIARLIVEGTGFGGDIRWDTSKPASPPRRSLDVSRAA